VVIEDKLGIESTPKHHFTDRREVIENLVILGLEGKARDSK
jgi:hypothetical protein